MPIKKKLISLIALSMIFALGLLFMTSCFKSERYLFDEKKYVLGSGPFELMNGFSVEDAYLDFHKIDKDEYDNAQDKTNLIQNRRNGDCYRIDFMLKFKDFEEIHCDCSCLEKLIDRVDCYRHEVRFILEDKNILIVCDFMTYSKDSSMGSLTTSVDVAIQSITIDNEQIQEKDILTWTFRLV